jgi:hypothetical protein
LSSKSRREFLQVKGNEVAGCKDTALWETSLICAVHKIRVIKSRKMRWVKYVVCVLNVKNIYKILVRKSQGKRPFRRPRRNASVYVFVVYPVTLNSPDLYRAEWDDDGEQWKGKDVKRSSRELICATIQTFACRDRKKKILENTHLRYSFFRQRFGSMISEVRSRRANHLAVMFGNWRRWETNVCKYTDWIQRWALWRRRWILGFMKVSRFSSIP